mmetsp:Transcript_71660/g.200978  ORF Transcript_71660/g.200978 Transcript_71660/m.200978 type:complete len:232 (-) Transcript_71660:19-714(-)
MSGSGNAPWPASKRRALHRTRCRWRRSILRFVVRSCRDTCGMGKGANHTRLSSGAPSRSTRTKRLPSSGTKARCLPMICGRTHSARRLNSTWEWWWNKISGTTCSPRKRSTLCITSSCSSAWQSCFASSAQAARRTGTTKDWSKTTTASPTWRTSSDLAWIRCRPNTPGHREGCTLFGNVVCTTSADGTHGVSSAFSSGAKGALVSQTAQTKREWPSVKPRESDAAPSLAV